MSTLVCSFNLWSCGLACIEAILKDNGLPKTQDEIIQNHGHHFSAWATQPGLMSVADFEVVFREVGFPVKVIQPATFGKTIEELSAPNTVGAVMWVSRFWDNPVSKNALVDLNHALRLVSANQNGVMVMNPYRCPSSARDEFYTWLEVDNFKGGALVFKK